MPSYELCLYFDGNCAGALAWYCSVFSGAVTMCVYYHDTPEDIGPGLEGKINCARFESQQVCFLASDARPDLPYKPGTSSIVFLQLASLDLASSTFEALSAGGTINIPFHRGPWNSYYGNCTDKYGITWSCMCLAEPAPSSVDDEPMQVVRPPATSNRI